MTGSRQFYDYRQGIINSVPGHPISQQLLFLRSPMICLPFALARLLICLPFFVVKSKMKPTASITPSTVVIMNLLLDFMAMILI